MRLLGEKEGGRRREETTAKAQKIPLRHGVPKRWLGVFNFFHHELFIRANLHDLVLHAEVLAYLMFVKRHCGPLEKCKHLWHAPLAWLNMSKISRKWTRFSSLSLYASSLSSLCSKAVNFEGTRLSRFSGLSLKRSTRSSFCFVISPANAVLSRLAFSKACQKCLPCRCLIFDTIACFKSFHCVRWSVDSKAELYLRGVGLFLHTAQYWAQN